MIFPEYRLRRLRANRALRALVQENHLLPTNFVYPLFVIPGKNKRQEILAMPGIFQLTVDLLEEEARECLRLGINSVILFGLPEKKDAMGSGAHAKDGIIQRAIKELKNKTPEIIVITDVCLCGYTDHGHCGCLINNKVDNDATLEILAKTALSHAQSGVDIVAPSDMMDGRVAEIRGALDENSFESIPIMSYAVKYASAFYGPFREATDCTPQFGDRKSYQMNPANSREAMLEATLDVEEGADIIMVKPASTYLDIISKLRDEFDLPIAAYHVSGEYAMIKATAQKGWVDEDRAMEETLLAIKRAGADIIITYFAKDMARILRHRK